MIIHEDIWIIKIVNTCAFTLVKFDLEIKVGKDVEVYSLMLCSTIIATQKKRLLG